MALPSVMTHDFSRVPRAEIPRSSFDRSHGLKTSFDAGYLVPIFWDEVLPGDTFSLNMTGFARLATPLHPFMDNVYMNTFFFAVPLRLIHAMFQKMMGEQDNPGDSIDFLTPIINAPNTTGFVEGSIFDYFGLPTQVPQYPACAYLLRAYNLVWNTWFRDQNLQQSVPAATDDGPDPVSNYALLRRGKRHDYFTSALPWPQKGPAVDIPLGTLAPVRGIGKINTAIEVNTPTAVYESFQSPNVGSHNDSSTVGTASATQQFRVEQDPATGYPKIYADLTDATAATINQLRQAFQIQKLYERDARGGTRYTEIIRAHFNVISPDARLQRPEYLGGGQSIVNLHTVPQNGGTGSYADTPQGNLAAYGTATLSGHGFSKSFTEHCVVIGLVSVRADLNYQQGLNRMWSRRTKYDFFWPALSFIGEQTVLNKEIFTQGAAAGGVDDQAFGYQERFAEYRYKPSVITGALRSNAATPLDTWHLAQDFASLPALNASFIADNPPIARVIAVPSEPHFIFDGYFQLRCARPMPVYGVPGLIDHF